ncbi:hypothetical protein M433DRAFT_547161 [Acidomyces richmondensis BFW]|nr:hypothetical protein M433DRAFT_547161 [Acidomyces richmondensis BFW]
MDNEYCDPVALASGIKQLIERINSLLLNIHDFFDALNCYTSSVTFIDRSFDDFVLSTWDLRTHLVLLDEASTSALNSPFPPPLSALSAANQSARILEHISVVFRKWQRACGGYADGQPMSRIQRLRALVELPFVASRIRALVERLEHSITRLRHIVVDAATQRLLEQARYAFESTHRTTGFGPESIGDPTLFDAEIVQSGKPGTHGCLYIHARGKLDNGADCNIVNKKILQKYGLDLQARNVESEVVFELVGGDFFKPEQKITLSWKTRASRQCLDTEFYVAKELQFDLLFGCDFIEEYGDRIWRRAKGLYPVTWTPSKVPDKGKDSRRHIKDAQQKSRERALGQINSEEDKWTSSQTATVQLDGKESSQNRESVNSSIPSGAQAPQNISFKHSSSIQRKSTVVVTPNEHAQNEGGETTAETRFQRPKVEEIIDEDEHTSAQVCSSGHVIHAAHGEDVTLASRQSTILRTAQEPGGKSVYIPDRTVCNTHQSVSGLSEHSKLPEKTNSTLAKQSNVPYQYPKAQSKKLFTVSKGHDIRGSAKVVKNLFVR